jgi:putative SOS response-associated peptidase YedK
MCGRGSETESVSQKLKFLREFGPMPEGFKDRYNIAPTSDLLIVRAEGAVVTRVMAHWNLIPSWWKDPDNLPTKTFNARAETVAEKASYKVPFKRRRCLVLMDGFYEWKALGEKAKQPYYIRNREPGLPLAFAGLWDRWQSPTGPMDSCTIITTTPNDLMEKIHDRMPVILNPTDYEEWLDPQNQRLERLQQFLVPCASEDLVTFKVRPLRGDGPELTEPLAV